MQLKNGNPIWQSGETYLAAGLLCYGEDADAGAETACPIANEGRRSGLYQWRCFSIIERMADTMMLTLTLAAGLLAAPIPQAEPQKGWVVEIHGFIYHPEQAEPPKGWKIEVGCHTYHLKQPRKEFIIEFQWPKAKPQREPVEGQYQPVEGQYYDDLSAFFKQQSKVKLQVEAVEALFVDDLPAYFKQLRKR